MTTICKLHISAFAGAMVFSLLTLAAILAFAPPFSPYQITLMFITLIGLGYATWIKVNLGGTASIFVRQAKYFLAVAFTVSLSAVVLLIISG